MPSDAADAANGLCHILRWSKYDDTTIEGRLGGPAAGDGVLFTLTEYPSCQRRGPLRLLIEVALGPGHHNWGCFDEQDEPQRWYHDFGRAVQEAEAIAVVMEREHRAMVGGAKVIGSVGDKVAGSIDEV